MHYISFTTDYMKNTGVLYYSFTLYWFIAPAYIVSTYWLFVSQNFTRLFESTFYFGELSPNLTFLALYFYVILINIDNYNKCSSRLDFILFSLFIKNHITL